MISINVIGQACSATWNLNTSITPTVAGAVTATTVGTGAPAFGTGVTSQGTLDPNYGSYGQGWSGSSTTPVPSTNTTYIQFSITPTGGSSLNISSINFNSYNNEGSPNDYQAVFWSISSSFSTSTAIVTDYSTASGLVNYTNGALSGVSCASGQTLYFRVYFYWVSASVWYGVKSMVLSGTTTPPPTSPATYTSNNSFTVPAGVTSLTVYNWGGGGGGGGSTTGTWFANGGGGGGGACAINTFAVTPGDIYTITIGVGGTAGPAGNNPGGLGGTTTFAGNAGTFTAAGGAGGSGSGGAGGAHAGGAGGSTGSGTIKSGGSGSAGNDGTSSTTGITGTGGGGGGSIANGTTPASTCAAVGTGGTGTYPGGTGGDNPNCNTTTNLAGVAGTAPGGGGSGANCWTSSFAGGAGGTGQVIVTWSTCTPPTTQASTFSTNTITCSSMNYAFTRGNGNNVMVIAKAGSAPSDPISGNSYSANSSYGTVGTEVGGGFCVYNGAAAGPSVATGNIAITGLSASTTYYFAIYEYATSGTCYNLTELSDNVATAALPTANAGGAMAAICQGGTSAALGGSVGGSATGGTWSDGGAGGTFNPGATTLNATYTASAASGTPVTLTLTTSGGSCGTASANKNIVVNPNPTVNPGTAMAAICQSGTSAALGGSVGGGATGGTWSDGGAGGTFNPGATTLNATYTASATSGSPVTLTLTTSGGSCGTTSANKNIVVNISPTANAGGAMAAICQGGTSAALGGSVGGSATGGTWSDGGAGGTFNPGATTLNATYIASATSGTPVTLTLTTSGGSCGAASANKNIVVNTVPGTAGISSPSNGATNQCVNSVTLNWTAASGSPTGYKLYYGTDNPPTNIVNGTNLGAVLTYTPSYPLSQGVAYYWKIVPTNGCGDATGASVWSFTTGTMPCGYCASSGGTSDGITNVTFAGVNNSTCGVCAAYTDYTGGTAATVYLSNSYNISVYVNTGGAWTNYQTVWIDWNQNGVFTDVGEKYQVGTVTNSTNGLSSLCPFNIAVPGTAALGGTRMRVQSKYNSYNATSCDVSFDGEVEDYKVNVLACSTPTTQATNITFSGVGCTQMSIDWTAGNGTKRIVKINTSNSFTNPTDGSDPAANTVYGGGEQVVFNGTTGPVTVTGLSTGTTYWYRVYEYNCAGASTKFFTSTAANNPLSQATSPLPSAAGAITTGTATVCQGQNGVAYGAAAIGGATSYGWNYSGAGFSIATGSGTNSITANFSAGATSGNLTIYGINSCGNGTASANYSITVNTLPSAAGSITTGTATVCQGQNGVAYGAAAIGGATSYGWNYSSAGFSIASGSGTNSITANFSGAASTGNLTIYGINACGNGTASPNYGITVNGIPGTAGISSPSNGATDQCSTNPITTLNWTAASGSPTGYKLYFGTDNPPTNIVNGTNLGAVLTYTPASLNTNTSYYWKIVPTNACGDAAGASVWSFTTGTPCYCTPTYSAGCGNTVDYIERVRIGTLDNTPAGTGVGTANCAARYVYYNGVAAPNLAKGDLYNLLITVGSDVDNFTAAWFDWNQDGDFSDAGEYFNGGNPGGSGTATINVTIPAGATTGLTRMRIRGGEDSDINLQSHACGASPSGFGESEDYKVNIISACTPPTTQATSYTSSNLANTTMTVGWTRGNGNNVMVIAKAGSAPSDPTNGTTYTANAAYGSGTAVGGGFCVYNGTGTSVNLTSLTANTIYHFAIYEYNTAGTCYLMTELTGNTQTANDGNNVNHPGDGGTATYYMCSGNYYDPGGSGGNYADDITVSTMTFYPSTSGSMVSLTFSSFDTENNYDGLMIYDGPTTGYPLISSGLGAGTNSTTCPAGSWRGTGTPGTVTSTDASGALTFVFRSDGSVNLTGWAAVISCISSCTPPSTQAASFSTNTITSTTMNYAFTRGNGTGGVMVIAKAGSAPSDPVSGTSYTANSVYGSGTAVGGGYCVYKGTAAGINTATGNIAISGLSCLTTYYFAVYEYNTAGTCFNLAELTGSAVTVPPGDETTYGSGSWIGYVYSWGGSPDFSPGNYKGYITQTETFDRNPADVSSGGNICGGAYTDNLSIRFKMNKSFPAGNYVFTIGGDDGVRLSVDGGTTWLIDGWADQGYTTYSNNPCVTLNGSTNLVFEYYENSGGSRASFSYTTVGGTCYCSANGNTCDEYISNVTVGSINNSTACTTSPQGYGDYTGQTTSMNIGTGYPITVTNGNPYSSDQCGIWVDWNQDADFADANEAITVSGTPGNGPYTATITPPGSASGGNTRMRVRIHYNDESTSSCGSAVWGEVEDYTINVLGCVAPTTSAASISFPSVQCTQMDVSWTIGNGGRRIVVAKSGSAIAGNPTDGVDYAENSSFGSGGTIAAGEYVVYDGTSSSFPVTNLTSGTTYYFKVFEYNCTGANIKYRTTSPPSANQATNSLPGTPSVITGSQSVCLNQTGVSYSVTIANANTYTWLYSGTGFTNTSGSVSSILADYSASATSGNLTVYGTSACGNGPASAALAITVNSTAPSSVDAGEDKYICANPATMTASGTGTWSVLNGTGTITTPSSPTSTVNVTNPSTSVTFRWSATNGCGTASDDVVIIRQ